MVGPQAPTNSASWLVFPASNRVCPTDLTRPVTSLKRAWEGVRQKAGIECRLHDLRHSFCTKMREAGIAHSAVLDIISHVSTAILRRYAPIRRNARHEPISAVRRERFPLQSP